MKTLLLRILLVCAGMAGAFVAPANAAVEININRGNVQPLPIAITDFISADGIGAQISAVVEADLKRSGLFAPVSRAAFIEKISNPDVAPRFEDWKVINAQALVTGRVTQEGGVVGAGGGDDEVHPVGAGSGCNADHARADLGHAA